jgi:hypothetical protein
MNDFIFYKILEKIKNNYLLKFKLFNKLLIDIFEIILFKFKNKTTFRVINVRTHCNPISDSP